MTKTPAFTAGVLRSLDTFGAGRQDQRTMEESKALRSTTPQCQMRARRLQSGRYFMKGAPHALDGVLA